MLACKFVSAKVLFDFEGKFVMDSLYASYFIKNFLQCRDFPMNFPKLLGATAL